MKFRLHGQIGIQDDTRSSLKSLEMCRVKKPEVVGFIGLVYQGKDIVCRFTIEYSSSSLRDFGP